MSSKNAPKPVAETSSLLGGRPWSLAARLTAWYAATAFALILGATGFLYWTLSTSLDRENDLVLADQVHILRQLLRERPEDKESLRQEIELEPSARQHSKLYVRVLEAGGKSGVETPGMAAVLLPEAFPAPLAADEEILHGEKVHGAEGRPFRVVTAEAEVGQGGGAPRILQVALDRSHTEGVLAEYRRGLWLVLGSALIACSLGSYCIARRGVRPLQEIAATARRIRSTTLHERIETSGLPAELADLAATFNDMFDRLEESFSRLSQFSADIAHELRTPVNNLRGEAEVALGKDRSAGEYREVLGSCLEECGRLGRLIDTLLFLARAEQPEMLVAREPVALDAELEKVREFYEASAVEAGVKLTATATGGLVVRVARPLLQRALGNLVANALAHTGPGGGVTLSAEERGRAVRIEVADTGCGIAADHLPFLFDRFYRVDRARSPEAGGGVGLGLAIVKSITEMHGGEVRVASVVGQGTKVTLSFPDLDAILGRGGVEAGSLPEGRGRMPVEATKS